MYQNRKKQQIVLDNPELVLCEKGDFKIKVDLVEQYEIMNMHCHIFSGLSQFFPAFLQKEKINKNVSLRERLHKEVASPFGFVVSQNDRVGGICGALLTNLSAWLSGIWFDIDLVGDAFKKIAKALPFIHAVELERAVFTADEKAIKRK